MAGYLGVALVALETRRDAPALLAVWRRHPPGGRAAAGLAAAVAALAAGLAVREAAPGLFERAAREEGLLEPLTLLCYLAGGVLLLAARPPADGPRRRHLTLLAGICFLFGLEEVDYFGAFGSLIGRVDGHYVGALHDVIGLLAGGSLSSAAAVGLAAGGAVTFGWLWRAGWLDWGEMAATLHGAVAPAAVLGVALLLLATLVEAGWTRPPPSPEEAIELAGGICLGLAALERAAREPAIPPASSARTR